MNRSSFFVSWRFWEFPLRLCWKELHAQNCSLIHHSDLGLSPLHGERSATQELKIWFWSWDARIVASCPSWRDALSGNLQQGWLRKKHYSILGSWNMHLQQHIDPTTHRITQTWLTTMVIHRKGMNMLDCCFCCWCCLSFSSKQISAWIVDSHSTVRWMLLKKFLATIQVLHPSARIDSISLKGEICKVVGYFVHFITDAYCITLAMEFQVWSLGCLNRKLGANKESSPNGSAYKWGFSLFAKCSASSGCWAQTRPGWKSTTPSNWGLFAKVAIP